MKTNVPALAPFSTVPFIAIEPGLVADTELVEFDPEIGFEYATQLSALVTLSNLYTIDPFQTKFVGDALEKIPGEFKNAFKGILRIE